MAASSEPGQEVEGEGKVMEEDTRVEARVSFWKAGLPLVGS